ncbi:MAG: 6-carboxytetrahydropterin synthase QueD [Methanomicrobia archaeon]|nr:6-carboxytetrahydropterin synthase QueD [Methanomicrobia archaeon]
MRTKVSKVFYFDAAHRIVTHKGKCKNLHGHTYKLVVTIEGAVESGMVIDFEDLKKIVDPVIEKYDHAYLNDFFENPTVENIAATIRSEIQKKTDKIVSVQLWEGRNNYAEVLP